MQKLVCTQYNLNPILLQRQKSDQINLMTCILGQQPAIVAEEPSVAAMLSPPDHAILAYLFQQKTGSDFVQTSDCHLGK